MFLAMDVLALVIEGHPCLAFVETTKLALFFQHKRTGEAFEIKPNFCLLGVINVPPSIFDIHRYLNSSFRHDYSLQDEKLRRGPSMRHSEYMA